MKNAKETVTRLMQSKYGELASDFILEAIRHHSTQISNSDPSEFTNPMRGGQNWHSVAQEIRAKLERV